MGANNFSGGGGWVNAKIVTGGTIGTMVLSPDVAASSRLVQSRANGAASSFDWQVDGDPLSKVNWPAGTYTTGAIYSISPQGVVTCSLGSQPMPTIRAQPANGGNNWAGDSW